MKLEGDLVGFLRACLTALVAAVFLATAGEEAHGAGADLEVGAGAVLTLPDARAACLLVGHQPALDQHLGAFLQVGVACFGLFAPGGDAEPDGFLDELAIGRGVLAVCRHAEVGDGLARGGVAHLGIASQVAYDDNGVIHRSLLLRRAVCLKFRTHTARGRSMRTLTVMLRTIVH